MSIFRQSAIILALGWLLTPVQFLTSAAVARAVGPEGRGVIFLLAGVTVLMTALTSFGVTSAAAVVYRRRSLPPGEIVGTLMAVSGISALILAGVYTFLSEPFVHFFLADAKSIPIDRRWLALALAVVPLTLLVEAGDVLLIGDDAMRAYGLRTAGTGLATVALTWVLTFAMGLGISGVLLAPLLSSLVGLAVVAWWFARRHGLRSLRCSRRALRELLRIGLEQTGVSLVAFVAKRLDAFIIARLLSLREAGFYGVANSLQNLVVNIPRSTVWPLVTKLSGSDPNRFEEMARTTRVLTAVVAVGSLGLVALAPLLVPLLFGAAFAPAVPAVCLALLGVIATPIGIGTNALFIAQGRPARNIVAALPAAGVQLALNFTLVPSLGAAGSAIALSANYFTIAAIQLGQVARDGVVPLRSLLVPRRQDFLALGAAIAARLRRGRSGGG